MVLAKARPCLELFIVPTAYSSTAPCLAYALLPNNVRYVESLKSIELVAKTNAAIRRGLIAMANEVLRQRQKTGRAETVSDGGEKSVEGHPGGDVKHGGGIQLLRLLLFMVYNMGSCFS